MRLLETLKAFILNTLFPPVCVSCKKEGDFLCEECLNNLDKKKIRPIYHKTEKDPDFHYMDGVIYALDYAKNPQIQAAVKQLKYRFTQELAEYFGDMIAEKIGELSMAKGRQIIFIPVPLHRKRLNYRGFNQAEIIANAVVQRMPAGRAEVISLLERARETQQQAKLNKEERHKNLRGAFKISDKFCHSERSPEYSEGIVTPSKCEGRGMNKNCVQENTARIWGPNINYWGERNKGERKLYIKESEKKKSPLYFLVDDVCTTGSTLENCAEVLKANGFENIYGLVIARAFK